MVNKATFLPGYRPKEDYRMMVSALTATAAERISKLWQAGNI